MDRSRLGGQKTFNQMRRAKQQFDLKMHHRVEYRARFGPLRDPVLLGEVGEDRGPKNAPPMVLRSYVALRAPLPIEHRRFPRTVERRSPVELRDAAQVANHVAVSGKTQNRAIDRFLVFPAKEIFFFEIECPKKDKA